MAISVNLGSRRLRCHHPIRSIRRLGWTSLSRTRGPDHGGTTPRWRRSLLSARTGHAAHEDGWVRPLLGALTEARYAASARAVTTASTPTLPLQA